MRLGYHRRVVLTNCGTALQTLAWRSAMLLFLARDAFVRTNRRAIVMMFVRLSVWDGRAL